jgi:hypothetical protein
VRHEAAPVTGNPVSSSRRPMSVAALDAPAFATQRQPAVLPPEFGKPFRCNSAVTAFALHRQGCAASALSRQRRGRCGREMFRAAKTSCESVLISITES